MRKMLKNKKKKGFTLIEMVAVVAIIGILAAILIPKVTGYMNEAKKTKVIDQARKVVQAYEGAKMKGRDVSAIVKVEDITKVETNSSKSEAQKFMEELITGGEDGVTVAGMLDKLPSETTIHQCKLINGGEVEFDLVKTGNDKDKFDVKSLATK